jgi:ribosome silencing factor RsfS/YbeB/iojap
LEEADIARNPRPETDTPKPTRVRSRATKADPTAEAPAAKAAKAPAAKAAKAPAAKAAKEPAKRVAKPRAAKPAKETAPKASRPAKPTGAAKARLAKAAKAPTAKAAKAAKAPAAAKPPAAPRPRRTSPRTKAAPALIDRLVAAAQRSLEADGAENILVLDVTGRADYADWLVIATGLVDRQIQAMATHLDEAFGKEGLKLRRDATQASDDWVLIDAGDLVVHLFKPEARRLYALERMWGPDSPAAMDPADVLPDDGSVPEADIDLDDDETD